MTAGRMRARLRAATAEAHERLHHHRGFAAAASGAIDLDAYRALLARLYGFHRAFDDGLGAYAALTCGTPRSHLLESDLDVLGVAREWRDALPRCGTLPSLNDEAKALGALYVVEGSALGGAAIARALAPLLAPFKGAGCQFFSSDAGRRRVWPELLARIEALDGEAHSERTAIEVAVTTFEDFEEWMKDWAPDADGKR
jgi:heme oxygenase